MSLSLAQTDLTFPPEKWSAVDPSAKAGIDAGTCVDSLAQVLVKLMLEKDPARRITAKEVLCDHWLLGTEGGASVRQHAHVCPGSGLAARDGARYDARVEQL